MARNSSLQCDVCRKQTAKFVGKIFYAPLVGEKKGSVHSNYTHHLDVGECCGAKVLQLLNFRERVTAAEYRAARKKGS